MQASPNWINGQQYSIIAVKDPDWRSRLAELCGNQKHIEEAPVFLIFCADFYRTSIASEMEGQPLNISDDIDSLIVGTTDVGIALGTAVAAAEPLGPGNVDISGIRRQSAEVIEMLELPDYVVPLSGLCIRHPAEDAEQKPRLPRQAVYHEERYNHELKPMLEKYNSIHTQYLQSRSGNNRIGT